MRLRSFARIVVALAACAAVAVAVFGWGPLQLIRQRLRGETPHQRYARSLAEGGLADTALATEWLAASARALQQPVALTLPFKEDALVDPARPVSLGYAVPLERGQQLDVQVTVVTDTPGQVFVDLFAPIPDDRPDPRPVASAGQDGARISYGVAESGTYVLRIQPELLRGGRLRVTSGAAGSLRFPVSGGGALAMQSLYGDARDGGRREHEGVDIFAPRGTPVVAASDGLVTRVGENTLGGRVIWIWDFTRNIRLYYAHLQEQSVGTGTFVRAGDTVGTVGNTGNARTTAPHLHFGIYARGEGAIDPGPFVRPGPEGESGPALKTSALGEWRRTRGVVALRASPSPSAPVLEMLPRASTIRVEGALGSWVRTGRRDNSSGFLRARELESSALN
jgi:murein DD-endopeptidase MepM/ murein hydrolase activator NlpD